MEAPASGSAARDSAPPRGGLLTRPGPARPFQKCELVIIIIPIIIIIIISIIIIMIMMVMIMVLLVLVLLVLG